MSDATTWVVAALTGGVVWTVGGVLYNAWRHPDLACRRCGGSGTAFSCTPILNRLVGGRCWWCRGRPWRVRRIARMFGWDRNSRFRTRR
jgi:hypothetical protein